MGRTMPSASQVINQAEQSFAKFRGAMRIADQRALDELFVHSHKHVAEIAYGANPLPFDTMILSMLVEEHKILMQLRPCGIGLQIMFQSTPPMREAT